MMHETAKSMIKNAIYAAGSRPWRVRRLRRELRDIDRVHAGCGVYRVNGWLNIELMSLHEISYGKVVYQGKAMLLNFDLTKGIPIADNQVSYLYSSHFIEHLSLDQGRAFLSEAFRVMKPGGRIRISCPALDIYIRHYANDDHDYFRKVYQAGRSFEGLATPGQVLMGQIQGWGHRWVYDHEGMEQELIRAGFRGFQRSSFRQGDFPDLIDLEPDGDARTIQSMYVEAAR